MSDGIRTALDLEELGGEPVEIRRYRLGFPHALALAACVIGFLVAASATATLVDIGVRAVSNDAAEPPIAFERELPSPRAPAEPVAAPAPPDPWAQARAGSGEVLSELKRALENAGRAQAEQMLTKAFSTLDQSDVNQLREFLTIHKDNPYAEELGYLPAVRRAVAERRLYRSENIVACGECWCWRERPVPVNDATVTQ